MNQRENHGRAEQCIAVAAEGGPTAIADRLRILDAEWSSGRVGKTTSCALIAAGLSPLANEKIRRVMTVTGGLLLAHSLLTRRGLLDGVLERIGFRSHDAIERERVALCALRGDFQGLPTLHDVENREEIDRLEGEGGVVRDVDEAKLDTHQAARELVNASGRA